MAMPDEVKKKIGKKQLCRDKADAPGDTGKMLCDFWRGLSRTLGTVFFYQKKQRTRYAKP